MIIIILKLTLILYTKINLNKISLACMDIINQIIQAKKSYRIMFIKETSIKTYNITSKMY